MSCMKSLHVFFLICAVSACISLSARADNNDTAAQAAYKEAKALFDAEDYANAADKFRKAYELKPSWKILFNIGQCEAAAKNHGLALEAFEMFLSEGGDDIVNDRREQVIAEVDRLRHMVGYLKVTAPDGTEIRVDGTLRGKAPSFMAFPVAAGRTHTVVGTLNGTELESHEFRVVGAQTITIELKTQKQLQPIARETDTTAVTPETEPSTATNESSAETTESLETPDETLSSQDESKAGSTSFEKKSKLKKLKTAGWIVTGVGAGALIAGGILGGMALSKNKELVDYCGTDPCPEKESEVEKNIAMANASTGLLIGGGVAAATGVILLIMGTKKEKQLARTTLLPAIAHDTIGAHLEWRF